jgi:prepilin-type N-terminal cleavage/methylation domain-containing protein
MQNTRDQKSFTIIEVLFAIVLIGIAIASLVAANISSTKANAAGTDLSTAEFLVEQIKELTVLLPVIDPEDGTDVFGPEEAVLADYDDLDDFDGTSFSPPINANRETLNDFTAFNQQITVENVNPANFEQIVTDHSSYFVRVTVKVFMNSKEISSTSWIRTRL